MTTMIHSAQAIIERVRRVSPALQRLEVALDATQREVAGGQLFLARITDSYDPYLREPWLPVARTSTGIVVERPALRAYAPGQVVHLLGPIGQPIALVTGARSLLLIAIEASPAALLFTAQQVAAAGGAVMLALLGQAAHYPLDLLPPEIEVVRASSFAAWKERDTALLWADQVIALAPPLANADIYPAILERCKVVRVELSSNYVQGLYHWPMPCGVGACDACLVSLQGGAVPACVDGPAFDLKQVHFG
jgi:hypothetical protein